MNTTVCTAMASVAFAVFSVFATPTPAQAAGSSPVIYPAKGQTAKEQDKDRYECHDWARGQTGYDPALSVQPTSPGAAAQPGATTGAMVQGAAGGAAVAELADRDAGKGAAAGALGAALFGHMRQRQAAQAGGDQAAQQQAARSQQQATYGRALAACMEARAYVVR